MDESALRAIIASALGAGPLASGNRQGGLLLRQLPLLLGLLSRPEIQLLLLFGLLFGLLHLLLGLELLLQLASSSSVSAAKPPAWSARRIDPTAPTVFVSSRCAVWSSTSIAGVATRARIVCIKMLFLFAAITSHCASLLAATWIVVIDPL
jgi:hypothetical protein